MSINRYINIVFYDISICGSETVKEYTRFRKYLLRNGYYQIQESVYACKVANKEKAMTHKKELIKIAPMRSQIRMLLCTKTQFQSMYILSGELSLYEQILLNDNLMLEL